jgi:hypothetical protein
VQEISISFKKQDEKYISDLEISNFKSSDQIGIEKRGRKRPRQRTPFVPTNDVQDQNVLYFYS